MLLKTEEKTSGAIQPSYYSKVQQVKVWNRRATLVMYFKVSILYIIKWKEGIYRLREKKGGQIYCCLNMSRASCALHCTNMCHKYSHISQVLQPEGSSGNDESIVYLHAGFVLPGSSY